MTVLKLDQWESRWSFARGATKATQKTNGRAITELTDALAEVDGLLAGINYLEKSEPESEDPPSLPAREGNTTSSSTFKPAEGPWFGHFNIDLPQLNPSSSEEQPTIETSVESEALLLPRLLPGECHCLEYTTAWRAITWRL